MNIYLHRKAPGKAVIQLSLANVCSGGATTLIEIKKPWPVVSEFVMFKALKRRKAHLSILPKVE